MAINASTKELVSGGLFAAFGAYFVTESLNYEVGTAFRMGPGFMPLLLGSVLVLLGIGVAASGLKKPDTETRDPVAWRGIILILGVIGFFAATIRGLGFVPVVVIAAFATAMASRMNSPLYAALLAIGLTVMCGLIFKIGLGFQVPWFGPWLGL